MYNERAAVLCNRLGAVIIGMAHWESGSASHQTGFGNMVERKEQNLDLIFDISELAHMISDSQDIDSFLSQVASAWPST
jgi:hypothetical protein